MKIIVELDTDKLTDIVLIQIVRQIEDEQDLKKFVHYQNFNVRAEIAMNPHTSQEDLDELSKDKNFLVRLSVASNKKTPESALLRLATDEDFLIRERVAERRSIPDSVIRVLSKDTYDKVQNFAIKEAKRRCLK